MNKMSSSGFQEYLVRRTGSPWRNPLKMEDEFVIYNAATDISTVSFVRSFGSSRLVVRLGVAAPTSGSPRS
jgi:hypothetical protein